MNDQTKLKLAEFIVGGCALFGLHAMALIFDGSWVYVAIGFDGAILIKIFGVKFWAGGK